MPFLKRYGSLREKYYKIMSSAFSLKVWARANLTRLTSIAWWFVLAI